MGLLSPLAAGLEGRTPSRSRELSSPGRQQEARPALAGGPWKEEGPGAGETGRAAHWEQVGFCVVSPLMPACAAPLEGTDLYLKLEEGLCLAIS